MTKEAFMAENALYYAVRDSVRAIARQFPASSYRNGRGPRRHFTNEERAEYARSAACWVNTYKASLTEET